MLTPKNLRRTEKLFSQFIAGSAFYSRTTLVRIYKKIIQYDYNKYFIMYCREENNEMLLEAFLGA